jgi:hypothetical protein
VLNQSAIGLQRVLDEVRAESLTLRQVVRRLSAPRGNFVGTPESIANTLQHWVDERGCDGFVLFEALPGQLDLFVDKIIPIRRGVDFALNMRARLNRPPRSKRCGRPPGRREAVASPRQISKRYVLEMGHAILLGPAH